MALLKLQDEVLTTLPSDHGKWTQLAEKGYELRAAHVKGVTALHGQVALLELEISRGQVGPGDLAKIFHKAKALGARAYGLASFVVSLTSIALYLSIDGTQRATSRLKKYDRRNEPSFCAEDENELESNGGESLPWDKP